MDPEANMKEQLELSNSITKLSERMDQWEPDATDASSMYEMATRLAELVVSLHEWKLKGGFVMPVNEFESSPVDSHRLMMDPSESDF